MYQPQVSVTTGQWIGFEALARWQKAPYGYVPPDEFIPLLEESGMIVPVGRWISGRLVKNVHNGPIGNRR